MPVPVTCEQCGKTETYPPSKAERRRFCSIECRTEWQTAERAEITCENCSKTDTYPQNQADTRRFCSIECKAEWQSEHVAGEDHPNWDGGKEEFTCNNCGKVRRRKPSEIGERNFCNPECKGEWMSEHLTGENHPQNTQDLWSALDVVTVSPVRAGNESSSIATSVMTTVGGTILVGMVTISAETQARLNSPVTIVAIATNEYRLKSSPTITTSAIVTVVRSGSQRIRQAKIIRAGREALAAIMVRTGTESAVKYGSATVTSVFFVVSRMRLLK